MKYRVYTDGATSNNGYENAVGGYAFIALDENGELMSDSNWLRNATNQRMELLAAIAGLDWLVYKHGIADDDSVEVFSDSAYLINCKNNRWYENWRTNGWRNAKKEPVANKELWEDLLGFFDDKRITWTKVKGHSGDPYNERVDKLAVAAKEKAK